VTGGAGFIGSHTSEALLQLGVPLAIVDNLDDFYSPEWKRQNLKEIRKSGEFQFYQADICNAEAMQKVFADFRPTVLVHLAARAGVRPSIEQPRAYEQTNVSGTYNLLEISRAEGLRKLVFGSSSSVYGASSRTPFSEDQAELRPISPYAATKLAGELICYTYAHLNRLPIICLRFFTVYGPRQRPDLAIHKFTARLEGQKAIPFFGDGQSGRDYTHVSDIVAGILSAVHFDPGKEGAVPFEVFNLGNSHPIKLSKLVSMLEKATGRKAELKVEETQPGDVPITWADLRKAERVLGYRPSVQMQEGLEGFVTWYREFEASRQQMPTSTHPTNLG
jgi:UDP-glucuronate 4-epimerase